MSCKTISIAELASITPVRPPSVNKKMKPRAHVIEVLMREGPPVRVPSQLKILIPVGIAITIVADVK